MPIAAFSCFTTSSDSAGAGRELASQIRDQLGAPPPLVLTHLTVNHDPASVLAAMREIFGPATRIVGCSAQGIMSANAVREDGYGAGAIGLGGEGVHYAAAQVDDIAQDAAAKGRALARDVLAQLPTPPKVVVLYYDPLCGVDMNLFLAGMDEVLPCPVIGGAAGHFIGPMQTTYQYLDERVSNRAAVALGIAGAFTPELSITTGCAPVGIEMTVTKCDGNTILEMDGRSALDILQEITDVGPLNPNYTASLAIGVPVASDDGGDHALSYLIRAAFGVDLERNGIVLQAGMPEGTKVMLHHRTIDDVLDGARKMGESLRERLAGRAVRAVIGFECGARTAHFLGEEATVRENVELQATVARDAAWLGLIAWGEVHPVSGRAGFHNYTYPLLALTD